MDYDDRTHPNAQLATQVEVALAKKRSDPVSDLWVRYIMLLELKYLLLV